MTTERQHMTPDSLPVLLARVMADIDPISKDQVNKDQGFKFRGIDDVFAALNPALVKHGVAVLPEAIERLDSTRATARGGTMNVVHLHMRYTFVGPAGDSLSVTAWGEAADSADKATAKAASVAMKVAMLQAFVIPTDEPNKDPDEVHAAASVPLPPIDVTQAIDYISKSPEDRLRQMEGTLPDAMNQGRISGEDAARIELAIDQRRDILANEAEMAAAASALPSDDELDDDKDPDS